MVLYVTFNISAVTTTMTISFAILEPINGGTVLENALIARMSLHRNLFYAVHLALRIFLE